MTRHATKEGLEKGHDAFPLRLLLHLPDRVHFPDIANGPRLQFQLEIVNTSSKAWAAGLEDRPLLELAFCDEAGQQLSLTSRVCPNLLHPARLAAGRRILFALSAPLPTLAPVSSSLRGDLNLGVEVRLLPWDLVAAKTVRASFGPMGEEYGQRDIRNLWRANAG